MPRRTNEKIREFILENVKREPRKISAITSEQFGVSRPTVNNYIKRLVSDGLLKAEGRGRARRYSLAYLVVERIRIPISGALQEDVVWRDQVLPILGELKPNVRAILHYGFTEMLNNVIDHSESPKCEILVTRDYADLVIYIRDYGVGVFDKIQRECDLLDKRHAILELSKGKLTTNPEKHTGEGIFFTSRMFDEFLMRSQDLCFVRSRTLDGDWLFDVKENDRHLQGTRVTLSISVNATHNDTEVFDKYQDDEFGFSRTHVSLSLARYGDEQLVSRSQAKRLMARVERFSEVFLDFTGIPMIGPAFADEIFRVFASEHPDVELIPVHASDDVMRVIGHALRNAEDGAQMPLFEEQ